MPTIKSSDGATIHYETHGAGAVNLMFLHGLGGGAGELWDGVVECLNLKQFRAICPDFRGHGKSGCPTSGYTWDSFSRDILAVADHAEAACFIPVGFSFGGKLACHLASRHPNRIPAQVLAAPIGPGTIPLEREAGLQLCRDATDWRRTRPYFRSWWFASSANEELVDACCKSIAAIPTFVLEACVEMCLWTSLVSEIGTLNLPTLIVVGENDPSYGANYQHEQMIPFLRQVTMAKLSSGHFIPLERSIELARIIEQHCHRPDTASPQKLT
jgi:non-heme chloroperoxidase